MTIAALGKNKIIKYASAAALIYIFINSIVYVDVTMRARSSYLKGLRYLDWHKDPQLKKEYLDGWLKKAAAGVKVKNDEEKKLLFTSIDMQYKMQMEDNDAKNAYFWFKTTIECFKPPRSKYVRLAEEKIVQAEKLWKKSP
ncbi:MAG: hypothetical protein COT16_00590 [Elusimicrobia bacterium CG08_land_8_20_14_0_20_44_26]|nr:MAG: hypothetical protein COT16_00590 [Elusimicrobia bacterium CG08_land_8_20_14_0_20_44_26]